MRAVSLLAALAVTAASCGGATPSSDRSTLAPPTAAATAGAPAAAGAPTGARPAFLTIPLTDVRTGERFTLGGFPGKVTFFIAMAVW